jgi:hypothetical protein
MSHDSKVTTLDTASAPAAAETKAAPKRVAPKQSGHDAQLSGKTVEINIYASEQEHGSDAVEVGLNGVMYLIPRGDYWPVPEEVVEVLRNAVSTVTSPAKNGGGVVTRDVPRFNFMTR